MNWVLQSPRQSGNCLLDDRRWHARSVNVAPAGVVGDPELER